MKKEIVICDNCNEELRNQKSSSKEYDFCKNCLDYQKIKIV